MSAEDKTAADLVLRLTDTITKLSTALLVVPMAFLKFVSDMGPKAHPSAVMGIQLIGNFLKFGIFVPFGLSVGIGLIVNYVVVYKVCNDTLVQRGRVPKHIWWLSVLSGALFAIGVVFLICLFFQFPIAVLEPFQLGASSLG